MKRNLMLMLVVPGALVAPAAADVAAVGEFAGDMYETFENVAGAGGYPNPLPLFGGEASLSDLLTNTVVVALNWNGPSGTVLPYNGNLMGGTPGGPALFEFATPVTHFGGYFNTVAPVGGGTAIFRDVDGNELGSLSFDVTPIEWSWVGWQSDVGIAEIEIMGASGPGFGLQYDDLTIRQVPAPGVAALFAAGFVACGRGRRR